MLGEWVFSPEDEQADILSGAINLQGLGHSCWVSGQALMWWSQYTEVANCSECFIETTDLNLCESVLHLAWFWNLLYLCLWALVAIATGLVLYLLCQIENKDVTTWLETYKVQSISDCITDSNTVQNYHNRRFVRLLKGLCYYLLLSILVKYTSIEKLFWDITRT